ncbi:MAG: hypothetical protein LUQ31_05035 [Methanoregula sp.]|nr:hypothetical protein [Methanoregula sp.]
MTDKDFLGIQKEKITPLISALLCAAVGSLFVSIGLQNTGLQRYYLSWDNPLYQIVHILIFEPFVLVSLGVGFVFLVSAIFFLRNAFEGEFFVVGNADWPTGSKFCIFLVVLWIAIHAISGFL